MPATGLSTRVVVLAGNPNTGKTTLFNQLTGGHARVGNYPGVTVEQHRGVLSLPDLTQAELLDSPGAYSLAARSQDEQIALGAVAGIPPAPRPDLVCVVVDASQLSRNLYYALQIIELGQPVVIALNMVDVAEAQGFEIDERGLSNSLGVPVVKTIARRGAGVDELRRIIAAVLHDPDLGRAPCRWLDDPELKTILDRVGSEIPTGWTRGEEARRRALAAWALLSIDEDDELTSVPDSLRAAVVQAHEEASRSGVNLDERLIEARYRWIDRTLPGFCRDRRRTKDVTDRVDRILLHPIAGFGIFLALMLLLFQSLFVGADPLIGAIENAFAHLGVLLGRVLPDGLLADFLIEGVLGGVGAFVVFLPQIVLLFLFLGLLEDSGYMARVAVLVDRFMRALGLNGRAFVPMLSGYACAVPAILATRTMERRRDRMITMLSLPLMTCAARLPVYALLIAALVPASRSGLAPGLLMVSMYIFGTGMALLAAFLLGKTVFKGKDLPLLIELPPYRMPHMRSVVRMVYEKSRDFLTKAGTIILLCAMILWFALSFPRVETEEGLRAEQIRTALETTELTAARRHALEEELAAASAAAVSRQLRESYAGRLGHAIEPLIAPLGFDWKIGVGLIGAFAAREVFVSTMGVVYGVGDEVDEESTALRERLAAATWPDGRKVFTPLVCLSLMVFFALACQCMSTLAVIGRETRTWRWPVIAFSAMACLAWVCSFAVYQGGKWLGFS